MDLKCLEIRESLWNFIPHNIFKMVGGLHFLLSCSFSFSKLPVILSKFYQQALLSLKLYHTHNFPHIKKCYGIMVISLPTTKAYI